MAEHYFPLFMLLFSFLIYHVTPVCAQQGAQLSKKVEAIGFESPTLKDFNNAQYYNEIGFSYYKLHQIPEAINAFKKVIALDPYHAVAYNNIGVSYLYIKDFKNAECSFKSAIQINPNYVKAAYNLAVALFWNGKYPEAFKAYKVAERINSDYVKKRFDDSRVKEKIKQMIVSQDDFPKGN